ncbi:MAG: hypothetical protein ACXVDI_25270, partial [Ktedonobacterales bacterium]
GYLGKGVQQARPHLCCLHATSLHLLVNYRKTLVTWLDALAPDERLRRSGLFGAKFQWLST